LLDAFFLNYFQKKCKPGENIKSLKKKHHGLRLAEEYQNHHRAGEEISDIKIIR
jgi:hypothetical protein